MKDDLLERFESLLDVGYQKHVIAVMREWCFSEDKKINLKHAELVYEDIYAPLAAWAESEYGEGRLKENVQDKEAIQDFVQKADDIVYLLRYNTRPLYPEHISILNNAWSFFQRSLAHRLHTRTRILKDYIDESAFESIIQNAINKALQNQRKETAKELQVRIDEEIKRREELAEKEKKSRIQVVHKKWQKRGVESARKYNKKDFMEWDSQAEIILKNNPGIKSIRELSAAIVKKLNYPIGADETIRKRETIINMMKNHKINKNIG